MKMLKRFLFVAVLAFATIGTTACGGANKTVENKENMDLLTTMVLEQPTGLKIELSYYGKGDMAFKQTTNNVIPYKALPGGTKEVAEKTLGPIAEKYKGLKGVTHKIEYGNDQATEMLEINFKEIDMEQIKGVPGLMLDGDPKNGVSVSKSVELLKQTGFVEKK